MNEAEVREFGDSSTGTVAVQDVALKSVEDVREPGLDPRISISSRPNEDELDESIAHKIGRLVHGSKQQSSVDKEGQFEESEPIYVDFEDGDIRNPVNFPRSKKWAITLLSCFSTLIAASTAGAYNLGFTSMTHDLNITSFQATIGLSLYALGFGIVPLVTASFSEEIGRQPLYVVSAVGVLFMYLMIALAQNLQTVLVARFIQGAFGSTWATMVGGTIADIWTPQERGLPMCIFAVAALGGTGWGPLFAGWIEMNPKLQWRWIQWVQLIVCAVYLIMVPFIMRETRSSIILRRLAKRIRKETGDNRYRARIEDQRVGLLTLIYVACTRPIHLMFTEPVVASFSLWIGFAWGILYCMVESISAVFRDTYHFDVGQRGSIYVTMIIGSLIGFCTNFLQERLYQRNFSNRGPEARLYFACIAAIAVPAGMFIYAWTASPSVPWIAPATGITLFIWAVFIIYLAVFTYLADCYGPFASSALAGQSLCRNLMATAFPLFTEQMFNKLSYKWANTMFGCISLLMIPIPLILFFYGPKIRSRSRFSRMVMDSQR
ncbi:MFS polyamine transporter [Dendrothele bispora CBS 962.96]|uniref:MFS polyamine transporter n=1 Tax=Dendrothele bispora (strain CBS 962.96) TaxID=1314807 RepID=A0A4S8LC33_DENBC|nr:MFS polyamine transporter [Dendrothele bispora CBS 962.96]